MPTVADTQEFALSAEQMKVFNLIENTNDLFYITGKAGSGKSTLLNHLRTHTKKRFIVAAPTGISAVNVRGSTIHSAFRLPPRLIKPDELFVNCTANYWQLLRRLDMLILDECSMVRVDVMTGIDTILKKARPQSAHLPFAGLQLIMFGDTLQLPPVVEHSLEGYFNKTYGSPYFFDSPAIKEATIQLIELQEVFRQTEPEFKALLDAIRDGTVTQKQIEHLNTRVLPPEDAEKLPKDGTVILASTNEIARQVNNKKLSKIPHPQFFSTARTTGNFSQDRYPTDEVLLLKKTAQVLMLANDRKHRWVNGSLGKITRISPSEFDDEYGEFAAIYVEIDGEEFRVPRETWGTVKYFWSNRDNSVREEAVNSFTQLPMKPAWGITIHKAQGATFDSVTVDLGHGAFAFGQVYTALSRCRSFEGLHLKRPLRMKDILVDQKVLSFLKKVQRGQFQ